MPGTLLDLANLANKAAKELPGQINEIKKQVSLAIVDDLVDVTPVDTSAALSNWKIRLGSAFRKFIKPYFMGMGGSTQYESIGAARADARDQIAEVKPGQSVYISNNAPYIEDLDSGSSRQFAGGFIDRARLIARVIVERVKIKL